MSGPGRRGPGSIVNFVAGAGPLAKAVPVIVRG